MERKIGEIFQHKGEWYQCVECDSCRMCSLFCTECSNGTKSDIADEVFGICGKIRRRDYKNAIFKKLEKVGEPFTIGDKLYLHVKVFDIDSIDFCLNSNMNVHNHAKKTVTIELEQNQENMEENKQNLKPFDLEAAKAGKPVCTRDGRKARIICFDAKSDRGLHIIALVDSHDCKKELVYPYNNRGICGLSYSLESGEDLMMLSEKCERWVNVFKMPNGSHNVGCLYSTKEEAISHVDKGDDNYIATVKIEWEE